MLTAILLEDHAWEKVAEPRRQEWRLAIRELLDDHVFRTEHSPLILRIAVDDAGVHMRWETPGQGEVAKTLVAHDKLKPFVTDYVDICRQMSALDVTEQAKLAVLDKAKQSSHDAGGRAIDEACDPLGPTLDTARRMFTLIVTLLVDTTQMSALRRPHLG